MYGDERLARDCVGFSDDKPIKTSISQWDSFIRMGIFTEKTTLGQARDKIGVRSMSDAGRMQDWSRAATASDKSPAQLERALVEKINLGHRLKAEEAARREAALKKLMAEEGV